jgi:hypothetical protein
MVNGIRFLKESSINQTVNFSSHPNIVDKDGLIISIKVKIKVFGLYNKTIKYSNLL